MKLRLVLLAYAGLWWIGLPVVLVYLWRRARRDPLYGKRLAERFGRYDKPIKNAVWVHAVSLGEMRSATPLIRALLDKGEQVVTTHFTPAGRREAERVFAREIEEGRMAVVWVPFEFGFAFRKFFTAFAPKYGLVMEIEIWPCMIIACRAAHVPLFMCNAQYPSKSLVRDKSRGALRGELMRGFSGALVKSDLQKERFAAVGVQNIEVTGELRFDQPVPPELLHAATTTREWLAGKRPIITIASAVEGEDALYIEMMKHSDGPEAPLFVYVPRAPERFSKVAEMIEAAGLKMAKRSVLFDRFLTPVGEAPKIDVLLGDSMGEMYFYLALADRAVVGGGFTPHGAHNIIEPLALKKPVIVGPEIGTIEYPAVEAIAAGVCQHVLTQEQFAGAISSEDTVSAGAIDAFFDAHSGAVARTLVAIPKVLAATSR